MPRIKITQERSTIRCLERHKRTMAALGLRRIRHSVILEDTPQIRGMIHHVRYLIRVEPTDDAAAPRSRRTAPKRAAEKDAPPRAPRQPRTAAKGATS